MKMRLPLYLLAALAGVLALIAGFGGITILFISDVKTAVIVLAAAGFIMCSSGMIGHFVANAPFHPLTIIAYIVGIIALFTGIVQIFNLDIPVLSDPSTALVVLTAAIVIKVLIARFAFLIKAKDVKKYAVSSPGV